MHRIQAIPFALTALFAAAMSGCMAGPVEPEDTQDDGADSEDVGAAESALTPGYSLQSGGLYPRFSYGTNIPDEDVPSCTMFSNGVVRGWHLKERNVRNFRYSQEWCRNMNPNGTLGSDKDFYEHFYYDGSGTLGITEIPLDKLPVGVRLQAYYSAFFNPTYRISDVAMLYASADDIYAGHTGYTQAPYALDRTDSTFTVHCPVGMVMTGIGVDEYTGSGSSDDSPIAGVKIHCQTLIHQ